MITNEKLKKIVEEFSRTREELGGKSFITNRREWFEKQMPSAPTNELQCQGVEP